MHRPVSTTSAVSAAYSPASLVAAQAQARQRKRAGVGGLRAGAGGGVINLACTVDSGRKKVLVVGGTGRVGGSTARWLLEFGEEEGVPVDVVLGGRSEKNYRSSLGRIGAKVRAKKSGHCFWYCRGAIFSGSIARWLMILCPWHRCCYWLFARSSRENLISSRGYHSQRWTSKTRTSCLVMSPPTNMNLDAAAVDAHSHIRVFHASALASFPPSSRARGAIATTAPLHALSNLSCT